ncbi:glutamyl-tRNA reductase [Ferroglobus sp.]|uniref:glutamyl-tRNA reductase n=1 Tax=Ferroglobus sp. TaxID=2614230 RepID=UPI0025B94960|nr:glutamyl-tRNA reductase [Ferroglobus sp.]
MEIASLVISHKKASIDEIQKAWHGDYRSLIERVLKYPGIEECVILMTCNRVEVYVVGNNTEKTLLEFAKEMGVPERIIEIHKNEKCMEHILRVASGLESMMVGEDQILGQVKDFYNLGKQHGGIGEILDLIFSKAIQVGRRVRRETRINKGAISIGSAAVELAERVLKSLKGKKALVVGAGKMAELVARSLAHKNLEKIYIANRTFQRGEKLAEKVGGVAIPFDKLEKYMVEVDVVFTATASQKPIITKEVAEKVMEIRKDELIIIDIALPRNVEKDVGSVRGIKLFTIDDLREISEENLKRRLKEAEKAERIVEEELENLKNKLKELRSRKALRLMYLRCEDVKKEEILEFYNKLRAKYNVDESVLPIIEDFLNSFMKKYLRLPTVRLKEAAINGKPEIIEAVEFLFGGEDFGISKAENEEVEKGQNSSPSKRDEIVC